MTDAAGRKAQFATMLSYLDHDPANASLLVDAAEAAIDAGEGDQARHLLDRAALLAPPGTRERHLVGLAAMQRKRHEEAARIFASLMAQGHDDPALRFNLAWSRAANGDEQGALDVLDERAGEMLPQAAALRVQLLHAVDRLEEAFAYGRSSVDRHPDHRGLAAALSVLALDMGEERYAAECAERADGHPDALATLGTLALGHDDAAGAEALFDRAIARNGDTARAWVGRGLARLLGGASDRAPADIDRGAELFGDHLGSWVAAGWAHFVGGDVVTSRARFERALALDQSFAETHGSLAVLDVLAGDLSSARERTAVALRLDRQSFSAALAAALLAGGEGDAARSGAIVQRALHAPIDETGRTVAQSLARIGLDLP